MGLVSAKQIKAARALLELTQKDLGRAAGVGTAVISGLEGGARDTNLSSVRAVVDALESRGIVFLQADIEWGEGVRLRPTRVRSKISDPIETADKDLRTSD